MKEFDDVIYSCQMLERYQLKVCGTIKDKFFKRRKIVNKQQYFLPKICKSDDLTERLRIS